MKKLDEVVRDVEAALAVHTSFPLVSLPRDAVSTLLDGLAASQERERVLTEHLAAVLRQSNSIEVLGEWVATDSNITSGKKLRAQVDAVLEAASAALTTPKGHHEHY